MSDRVDVLVVGAGLAGLHTATRLAERGHEVVLAERRVRQGAAIRTTGIFVRKTLDDFGLPEDCLGPPIRRVRLYPPDLRRPVTLLSDRDEFRVGDMGRLYEQLACDAGRAGVALCPGTRYLGRQGDGFLLQDRHGTRMLRARFVVGADGARSRVAVDLGLDRNRQLLAGAEEVYDAPANVEPTFHCVIDPLVAPGYLAWVVNDGQHAHVGVAGYPDRFEHGLRAAMGRFAEQGPAIAGLARPAHVQRRAGLIPVGGLLRRISSRRGLLVGDAAGAVSPLTAGGLDPCLRLSDHAADVLHAALRTARPDDLRDFDGSELRSRFTGRLMMRRALSSVHHRAAAQTAFRGLRTAPGRAAARHILFGDRSFPDTPSAAPTAGSATAGTGPLHR